MSTISGKQLGPYIVGERVVETESGEWFAASEAALERPVSILVTRLPEDEGAARVVRERARRLVALADPRLLPIYSQGEDGDVLWLATRQPGRPLGALGQLDRERAARIGAQLAHQLAALGEAEIAPDYVTAEDVAVEGAGEQERAWLLPDPLRPASADASSATLSLVDVLEEDVAGPLVDDPSPDPEALAAQLAPLYAERRRRPHMLVTAAAGGLVLAFVVAAVLAGFLTRDSGSTDANALSAEVVAEIPIGAKVTKLAADDRSVWATTPDGELIQVDIESERVVGAPRQLLPKDSYVDLISDGTSVWAGAPGLLLRLNSSTGRVLAKEKLGKRAVEGLLARNGSLFLTLSEGTPLTELVMRDLVTGQDVMLGASGVYAVPVAADEEYAWVIGGDASFTRLHARRAPQTIGVGGQAGFPFEHEGRVWIPTRADRTLVAVDPVPMTIEKTLHFEAEPWMVTAGAGSIWVLTQEPSQVHRIDPATARFIGRPLVAPAGASAISFGGDSIWVDDPNKKALVRLQPTEPAPSARDVEPAGDVLRNGPIPKGVRLRVTTLEPDFSIQAPDEGWLVEALTLGGAAQFELLRHRRHGNDYVGVSIAVTSKAFSPSARLVPIRTPSDFLRILRDNRSVRIQSVAAARLGGRPGLNVRFETVPQPPFPDLCHGAECVPLFPQAGATFALLKGTEEFTIVKQGRGVFLVDATFSDRKDPEIGRKIDRLVGSIRFER